MEYNVNSIGRIIPDEIGDLYNMNLFNGANENMHKTRKTGSKIRVGNKKQKLVSSLQEAIIKSGLRDGMTISFHHHLRNGDYIINMVIEEISKLGIKNIVLASSSLSNIHDNLIKYIKNGTITEIQTSGLRGELGREISKGILKKPVIIRSHGGRARAIEDGELKIDVAFIAAPSSDEMGNISGSRGKSACGSLGYAITDATFADCVIAITDNLVQFPNIPCSIGQMNVDYVVEVDEIGDPSKIVSGSIRFNDTPRDLVIAKNAVQVIKASGYYKDGFNFQTGAAGSTLAVTKLLIEEMKKDNIKASSALGGITGYTVDMLENGLLNGIFDTQSFDLRAVESIEKNYKHFEISSSAYANPNTSSPIVDNLDFTLLGALEIDTDFNVNVLTLSDGVINQAIGGHQDSAAGSKMSIIMAPLVRGRNPIIVDKVTTVCTPGESIDVVCTDYGIAVNPKRKDLREKLKDSRIKFYEIEELQKIAENITGKPNNIEFNDTVVAIVEYRDGSILDVIRKEI